MSTRILPDVPAPAAPDNSAWFEGAWDAFVAWVRQESAVTQALIEAFIAVGIAFGWWHRSNAQTGTVVGISAALPGMFVRSHVTPLIPMDAGRPLVRAPDQPGAVTAPPAGRRGKSNGH